MNLSEYRTRLVDLAGNNSAAAEEYYNRVINDAYLELAAMTDWWWLETHTILRFEAPVTSKSFVADVAATALTAVGTADYATSPYAFGWAESGEQTYRVREVSTAQVLLDAGWIEASGTYAVALWNDMLELPAGCDQPVALVPRNDPAAKPLKLVDQAELEAHGLAISDSAQEVGAAYAVFREPVYHSTRMVLRIWPPPDQTAEYLFRYKAAATAMADDTASTMVPPKFEPCLSAFVRLKYLRDQREDPSVLRDHEIDFQRMLAVMQQAQSRSCHTTTRMGRRLAATDRQAMRFKISNVEAGGI